MKTNARKTLGVGMHSYGFNWRAARQKLPNARFNDALSFLTYCHELRAGGVQTSVATCDTDCLKQIRSKAEAWEMYFEAQSSLPRDKTDLSRFENEVKSASRAGAGILRTAALSGRRYENFLTAEAFRLFAENAWKSLTLVEPVMRRHRVKLALENHKDWRMPELIDIMRRLSSAHVGVTLDTGNSIALLEDPVEVVEALAPFAVTTHLKDMAVKECEDGFFLSEVPLGEGFLDLRRIVEICRKANPEIQFNLEMITRDPLRIPCLKKTYWPTLEAVPARDLARAIAMVQKNVPAQPLPVTSGKSMEEQLAFEDQNVWKSLVFAREKLGL